MALWLVRTGSRGQHESRFLEDNRVYLGWTGMAEDVGHITTNQEAREVQHKWFPEQSEKAVVNYAAMMLSFVRRMKAGDWVVVPSGKAPAIHIAKIVSEYKYDADASDDYRHFREVEWLALDIPRSNFDQDLLYSFGAFMAVCQIKRNNAESRLKQMAKSTWKSSHAAAIGVVADSEEASDDTESVEYDLATAARDQIAKLLMAKYKGHGMARLVEAILKAQGYTTHLSPEGSDQGVDILAAPGPLGFGDPRLCVQVKSGDSPLDRPTLDQLIGAMQNFGAQQGLLVSWGGFKGTVNKEEAKQFFRVRLWDQDDLIELLLEHYDRLDADLRAELPLKRIWIVAGGEADSE